MFSHQHHAALHAVKVPRMGKWFTHTWSNRFFCHLSEMRTIYLIRTVQHLLQSKNRHWTNCSHKDTHTDQLLCYITGMPRLHTESQQHWSSCSHKDTHTDKLLCTSLAYLGSIQTSQRHWPRCSHKDTHTDKLLYTCLLYTSPSPRDS